MRLLILPRPSNAFVLEMQPGLRLNVYRVWSPSVFGMPVAFQSRSWNPVMRHGRRNRVYQYLSRRGWRWGVFLVVFEEELWNQRHCDCQLWHDHDQATVRKNRVPTWHNRVWRSSRNGGARVQSLQEVLLRVKFANHTFRNSRYCVHSLARVSKWRRGDRLQR